MEKLPHQEYRDDLADKLKEKPDNVARAEMLKEIQESPEYIEAKEKHLEDIKKYIDEKISKEEQRKKYLEDMEKAEKAREDFCKDITETLKFLADADADPMVVGSSGETVVPSPFALEDPRGIGTTADNKISGHLYDFKIVNKASPHNLDKEKFKGLKRNDIRKAVAISLREQGIKVFEDGYHIIILGNNPMWPHNGYKPRIPFDIENKEELKKENANVVLHELYIADYDEGDRYFKNARITFYADGIHGRDKEYYIDNGELCFSIDEDHIDNETGEPFKKVPVFDLTKEGLKEEIENRKKEKGDSE